MHYTPSCKKNKSDYSHPPKMSVSPPIISMSDEEDTHIHEHEVALTKVKCMKEERQRQREEET